MKIKKLFCSLLAILSLSVAAGTFASAENDVVTVMVDNEQVEFEDQTPVIIEGHTLVPVRAVFEKAGAQVSWDQDTQTQGRTKG